MGELSNQLLVVTIFCYVLAMMAYAIEYAFGGRSVVARAAVRELATVGGPSVAGFEPAAERTDGGGGGHKAGVAAVALTVLGYAAHVAALVTRGIAADRAPWGNMYEFVLTGTLVGM